MEDRKDALDLLIAITQASKPLPSHRGYVIYPAELMYRANRLIRAEVEIPDAPR